MEEGPDISKTAWVNVFARPSRETLVGELPPEDAPVFGTVAAALAGRAGWKHTLVWLGLPWRWAFVYTSGGESPALVYHVPDPRGSRLCIPVPVAGEGVPDMKALTKPVRTRLEQAAIIAGYIWPEWTSAEFDAVALEALLAARVGTA